MRVSATSVRSLCVLSLLTFAGCGGALQGSGEESTPGEESVTSEALPIPEYEEEVPAAEEPAAEEPASEPEAADADVEEPADADVEEPECVLDVDQADVVNQVARFRRWLLDQSVGRRITVVDVTPQCGNRGGFLVAEIVLTGPAGGLQSMSRALTSYYPGSSWTVTEHRRLEGGGVPLRVNVEVRVPTGAEPVPRCEWDEDLTCEDSDGNEQ